jgi:hypothetical protein
MLAVHEVDLNSSYVAMICSYPWYHASRVHAICKHWRKTFDAYAFESRARQGEFSQLHSFKDHTSRYNSGHYHRREYFRVIADC